MHSAVARILILSVRNVVFCGMTYSCVHHLEFPQGVVRILPHFVHRYFKLPVHFHARIWPVLVAHSLHRNAECMINLEKGKEYVDR